MDQPALLPLQRLSEFSSSEVGETALKLAELKRLGLPIAPTKVILSSTLEKVAQETNLTKRLRQALDSTPDKSDQEKLLKKLQGIIRTTELPMSFIKEILALTQAQEGLMAIYDAHQPEKYQQENIKGEANLLESILEIWAEHLELDFDQHQLRLFQQPLLVQVQSQPQMSGVALTRSSRHKSQLQIKSVWGVFVENYPQIQPDEFEIDVRTLQVTSQYLQPQYLQLTRTPDKLKEKVVRHYQQTNFSLNKEQLKDLAHFIITIKRKFVDEYQVAWSYSQGKFWIHHLNQINLDEQDSTLTNTKTLLTGQGVTGGIVAGDTILITNKSQLIHIRPGQVVITSEVTTDFLPILNKVTAIICDHGLSSPSLRKFLEKNTIPTIINTKHATRFLNTGMEVIVNANAGRVVTPKAKLHSHLQNSSSARQNPTFTKVYISAGNPKKARAYLSAQVDGVGVLRSEYTYARMGEHPKYLIKTGKKHQIKQGLRETIQAYRKVRKNLPLVYRTLDLTSKEFESLAYAQPFENSEPNPYLGFRGGIRTLNNFELLDLEVEVLKEIKQENNLSLGLMLPFIRTPSELRLIKNYLIHKHDLNTQSGIELYLQLNTPENIYQLEHYLAQNLSGISINARSLHALLHGIDPENPDIFALYPYDLPLMEKLIKDVKTAVKQYHQAHPPTLTKINLHLEDNNLSLAEKAAELNLDFVTVKPDFAPRVKQRVQEIQTKHILKK